MGFFGSLLGSQATATERRSIEKKCSRLRGALHTCRDAYSDGDVRTACAGLEMQMLHCACGVVCKELAKEYDECVQRSASKLKYRNDDECSQVVKKMRDCLKKKKVSI